MKKHLLQKSFRLTQEIPKDFLHDATALLAEATNCAAFCNTIKDEYDSIQGC